RTVQLSTLALTFGNAAWVLSRGAALPAIAWSEHGVDVQPVLFLGGAARDQRLEIAGTWRDDGRGALTVTGRHVFLETLAGAIEQPARYGGVMDLDATLRGTRAAPLVTGNVTITNGRVERLAYQRLAGRVDYSAGLFTLGLRLDQS